MARQRITGAPVALAGLEDGQLYAAQNRSPNDTYVEEAAAPPADNDAAFLIEPFAEFDFQPSDGRNIYIWSDHPAGRVTYNPAPD